MQFRRSQTRALVFLTRQRERRRLDIEITVLVSGAVDRESGMVINLTEVDEAFQKLQLDETFSSPRQAIQVIWKYFSERFPNHKVSVEISHRNRLLFCDGRQFFLEIETSLDFVEDSILRNRRIKLRFQDLSFSDVVKWLRQHNKKSRKSLLAAFFESSKNFQHLAIQFPEWQGWELYALTSPLSQRD